MQRSILISVAGAAIIWTTAAAAQNTVLERLANLERRVQYLEKRVTTQDATIVERDREITRLRKEAANRSSRWYERVDVFGSVEMDGSLSDPYSGGSASDATVSKATIGAAVRVHDWVNAEVALLYEEDDTPLEVDIATITVAPPDGPWKVKGGQFYVPFGTFESNLISDPLTLEVGETRETALSVGFDYDGFSGSIYGFNGTNKKGGDSRLDGYGATLGYAHKGESSGYVVSVGYINDVGDSDKLQDAIATNLGSNNVANHVDAWTASGKVRYGQVSLIAEYLATLRDFRASELSFNGTGARPSAWNVEAGYALKFWEKDARVAAAYQGTDESLALSLPERRFLAGLTVDIIEHASVSLEWAHDWDYGTSDGGTGKTADTVTGRMAVEF